MQNFVGKPLGKCPLRRLRRKCEGNIKMDVRDMGCENGRWMELAEDHVQWQALNLVMLDLIVLLQSVTVLLHHGL
jgi:hypothetical protein